PFQNSVYEDAHWYTPLRIKNTSKNIIGIFPRNRLFQKLFNNRLYLSKTFFSRLPFNPIADDFPIPKFIKLMSEIEK
ncbi:hypothetical protein MHBO_000462, partial [Bonamia ostreae]